MHTVARVDTPVGGFAVAADADGALVAAGWVGEEGLEGWCEAHELGAVEEGALEAAEALAAWLEDPGQGLGDWVLRPAGTDFQQDVWRALREVPQGATISYAELAARVGRPKGAQAVGAANGANPLAVFVPCHRVVGSAGQLTGYAGGLRRKEWLLAHEGARSVQLGLLWGAAHI